MRISLYECYQFMSIDSIIIYTTVELLCRLQEKDLDLHKGDHLLLLKNRFLDCVKDFS